MHFLVSYMKLSILAEIASSLMLLAKTKGGAGASAPMYPGAEKALLPAGSLLPAYVIASEAKQSRLNS